MIIDVDKVIDEAAIFVTDFISRITDTTEKEESKMVYFLDNQKNIKDTMDALDEIQKQYRLNIQDEDEYISNPIIIKITQMQTQLTGCMQEFKNILINQRNVDYTPVKITDESISNAMRNNPTTQEMINNINNIEKTATHEPNYVVRGDGVKTMMTFYADDKNNAAEPVLEFMKTYNLNINQVHLYELKPMKIATKTTLSIG